MVACDNWSPSLTFGHSPIPASLGQTSIGAFFSDMTYYTDASTGAGVLDTGTNNWIPALDDRSGCHPGGICEATMVQRITGNILKIFGQGPAARLQPSVPIGARSPASKAAAPRPGRTRCR